VIGADFHRIPSVLFSRSTYIVFSDQIYG
jgi:hypothetical protein